jgi:hypothetical protein
MIGADTPKPACLDVLQEPLFGVVDRELYTVLPNAGIQPSEFKYEIVG